jgi:YidC/Oxa1 family membrane protein insertase
MLNDEQDKDAMRRQAVALVIMLLLFWGWFTYFAPKPRPPAPTVAPAAAPGAQTAAAVPAGTAPLNAAESAQQAAAWPFLPPVPTDFNPADDVTVHDNDLELVFTRIGARLKRATVLLGDNGAGNVQLVPQPADGTPDTQAVYPLGLHFSDPAIGDGLDTRRFDYVVDADGRGVTFSLDLPGAATVRKHFHLGGARHVVDVSIEYQNREATPRVLGLDQIPAYILNWAPGVINDHHGSGLPPKFVWRRGNQTEVLDPKKLPVEGGAFQDKRVPAASWIGYKTLYFLAAMRPAGDGATDASLRGTPEGFRFGLYQPKFDLAPDQTHAADFRLYLGPVHLGDLSQAWPTLTTALRFYGPGGWFGDTVSDLMDWFAKILLKNLNWWHSFIPNYGVAIILLTVLVRMVVFPLTIKSIRSMKKMQALQPEMAALKEKYTDNPQELQRAMMLIYKERKINPLAGCLPVFFQMPVFFALYRMLWYAFELRGAKFLWITDLSQPDRMFHFPALRNLPLLGNGLEYFNLLPFLVCGGMILSFRLMPQTGPTQNPQQKLMMNLMPIMFTVMGYKFAAGLNLYVFTSTLLGIVQNRIVRATDIGGPAIAPAAEPSPAGPAPAGKKPADTKVVAPFVRRKKPQHFYDRAQQRKREMAKADKKRPKKK